MNTAQAQTVLPQAGGPAGRRRCGPATSADPVRALQAFFRARYAVRRGICLLNAARYDAAAEAFQQARVLNPTATSLARCLAACHRGADRPADTAAETGRALADNPSDACCAIRHALTLWTDGRGAEAIRALRDAIERAPNDAELQFQLGVMLATHHQWEEAELRFAQAVAIDKNHVDALVYLALCHGARQEPQQAVRLLHKAVQRRPDDARIGLLLAQAARAAQDSGDAVCLRLVKPPDVEADDPDALAALTERVSDDPDFVDALLALPWGDADRGIYLLLLEAVRQVLARQGEHADLHYQCGVILDRLGRSRESLSQTRRAVELDPTHTRALIELAHACQRANRPEEALKWLHQITGLGREYADVYYLLGNAHRQLGSIEKAATAYRKALRLNRHYEDARRALESLPQEPHLRHSGVRQRQAGGASSPKGTPAPDPATTPQSPPPA
ncbi:MAG: tetratricopeptide repeat protein [Phycisphaerales bacterium]|nr:MAG: tetratricopeptide repeat protein [Phycisphaerales bacterium]